MQQSDQQLISQLQEAAKGAKQTLDKTKQRHKARITALRAEQRREIHGLGARVKGYEKALKAVRGSNGQGQGQRQNHFRFRLREESGASGKQQEERGVLFP